MYHYKRKSFKFIHWTMFNIKTLLTSYFHLVVGVQNQKDHYSVYQWCWIVWSIPPIPVRNHIIPNMPESNSFPVIVCSHVPRIYYNFICFAVNYHFLFFTRILIFIIVFLYFHDKNPHPHLLWYVPLWT
jgi:hypothetical protein